MSTATMHDAMYNRQSKPGTLPYFLITEKGVKHTLHCLGVNSPPAISDGQFDKIITQPFVTRGTKCAHVA